jgi:hypothetical protein
MTDYINYYGQILNILRQLQRQGNWECIIWNQTNIFFKNDFIFRQFQFFLLYSDVIQMTK